VADGQCSQLRSSVHMTSDIDSGCQCPKFSARISKVLCTRHDHPGGMRLSSLDDRGLRRYIAGHLAGEVACYGESAFCKVTTRHTGHNAEYSRPVGMLAIGASAPISSDSGSRPAVDRFQLESATPHRPWLFGAAASRLVTVAARRTRRAALLALTGIAESLLRASTAGQGPRAVRHWVGVRGARTGHFG